MRTLVPLPAQLIDPVGRTARVGSFVGSMAPQDLSPLCPWRPIRFLKEKRWLYVSFTTGRLLVGVAVVDAGYAIRGFVFAYDTRVGSMVVDWSAVVPPGLGGARPGIGDRVTARLTHPRGMIVIREPLHGTEMVVAVSVPGLTLDARLDVSGAPPGLTAVAPVRGGSIHLTEKRALLPVRGRITLQGGDGSLDGALGGFDWSHGFPGRHARWNWAFMMGQGSAGERLALNLVQGFVGEPECALWFEDQLFPLSAGRFTFNRRDPLQGWQVSTEDGSVQLAFTPRAMHAEHTNAVVVRTRFVQPVGTFRGVVNVPNHGTVDVDHVLGVVEDQDTVW